MTAPRVLLVGAGPAGISAALWLHDLEIPFRWINESHDIGGTLLRVGNPIRTWPGHSVDRGRDLIPPMLEQLRNAGLAPESGVRLAALARDRALWVATLDAANAPDASPAVDPVDAVLLATGTRPRRLGIDGEDTFAGRGVEISVSRTRERYRGQRVCVVGGGDAALEGALLLAEVDCHVHLIHRRTQFRGQRRFVERVLSHPSIEVHLDAIVDHIAHADGQVTGVALATGEVVPGACVFVRVGVEAALPGLPESVTGPDGYLVVDRSGRTPAHGLYACGDVTGPQHQSVSAAVGDAARAVAAFASDFSFR